MENYKEFENMMKEMMKSMALIAQSNNNQIEALTSSMVTLSENSQKTNALITGVSNRVDDLDVKFNAFEDRMDNYELNEEVTTEQEKTISRIANKRVYEIIGSDEFEDVKYHMTFIQNLYSDARKYAFLGSSISTTKKRDYQRVIDYIEAWIPRCGCVELKRKADKRAVAKRKAKELGYN